MFLLENKINLCDLKLNCSGYFDTMVKGVIDIEKSLIALDAEMHADLELWLCEEYKSKASNTWGFNIYFEPADEEHMIEYNSLINLKPNQNNFSIEVKIPEIRDLIKSKLKEKIIYATKAT